MMRGQWPAVAAAILVLGAGVVACGDDDEAADGGAAAEQPAQELSFDLTVGDLVPLTGDLSVFGPAGRKAGDLAVQEIEAATGEVAGDVQVTIEHADTETASQAAVQAGRQLISNGPRAWPAHGPPPTPSRSARRSRRASACR